jgi:hypothetical protein
MTPESHWIEVPPATCSVGWRDRYGQMDGMLSEPLPIGVTGRYWPGCPSRHPDHAHGAWQSALSGVAAFADRFRRHSAPSYEPPPAASGVPAAPWQRYSSQGRTDTGP